MIIHESIECFLDGIIIVTEILVTISEREYKTIAYLDGITEEFKNKLQAHVWIAKKSDKIIFNEE